MKDPSSSVRKEGPPCEQAAEGYGQSPSGKGKKPLALAFVPCTATTFLFFIVVARPPPILLSLSCQPCISFVQMYLGRCRHAGAAQSCKCLAWPGPLRTRSLALLGDTGLAQQLGPDLPKESQGPAEEDGVSRP